MSDKREISFDILENTDIETVEKLERDIPMVSEKDRNRILEMSLKKFESGMNKSIDSDNESENVGVDINDEEFIVSGVEKYSKPKMSKAAAAFIGAAAALAIIISGIRVFSHNNNKIDEPMQDSTSTSLYEENPSKLTLRYAQDEVLGNISEQMCGYSLFDVNKDDVPELIVNCKTTKNSYFSDFYYFNGIDYVREITLASYTDEKIELRGVIKCNEAENLIWCEHHKEGGNAVYKMNGDNTFESMGCFENDDEFLTSREWVDFSYEGLNNSKTWTDDNKPTKAMLDAARDTVLESISGTNIEYAYCDVNMDGVEELIVSAEDISNNRSSVLFYFNGTGYTSKINPSKSSADEEMPAVLLGEILCLPDENLVWCTNSPISEIDIVLKMLEDNNFEVVAADKKDDESYKNKNWLDIKFKPYESETGNASKLPDMISDHLPPEAADAMIRLLEKLSVYIENINLNLFGVNDDNTPEIIITKADAYGNPVSDLYYFNGTDYVNKLKFADDTENILETDIIRGDIKGNSNENLIWCKNTEGEGNAVYKMHTDSTFEIVGIFEDNDEFLTSREWVDFKEGYSEEEAGSISVRPQEIHDLARNRLLETLSANQYCSVVEYAYCEMNSDGTPELIINFENMSGNKFSSLYFFNGADYLNAAGETEKGVIANITGNLRFCPFESLIWCEHQNNGEYSVYKMNYDNTFELKDTFEEPDAANVNNQLGSLYNHYNNKEWINIEFTPYK